MRNFLKGIKQDWKKIVWPTKRELVRKSIAVIGIGAVTAVLIVGVDTVTQYGVGWLVKILSKFLRVHKMNQ